jgi:hypothetical protein
MAPTAKTADLKASLAQMTPVQQDIFGRGMASQMAQTALNANVRRNVIGMFNSPEMAQRLQLGMGPQRANEVEAFLRRESFMDMLRPAVTGNSSTAKQGADMLTHGFMGALAKGATNPLVGGALGGYGAYETNGLDPVAIAKGAAIGAVLRETVLRETGRLACEVCGFDFNDTYGEPRVHTTQPLRCFSVLL